MTHAEYIVFTFHVKNVWCERNLWENQSGINDNQTFAYNMNTNFLKVSNYDNLVSSSSLKAECYWCLF